MRLRHRLQENLSSRLLSEGTLFGLLGLTALACTFFGVRTMIQLQGLILLASGLSEVTDGVTNRVPGRSLRTLLSGVLACLAGFYLVARPGLGVAGATLVVGMFLFAGGAFRFLVAALQRFPQWRWCVAYGVASISLGVIAVGTWPKTPKWMLGAIVGAELLLRCGMLVAMGVKVREPRHRHALRS